MAFWDKFRRRSSDTDDSYYRDEPTTNKFTAVLFGFFALFVTLLIAGGLYFGGRAVYRALNGTPAENNTAEQQKQNDNNQNKPNATSSAGTSSNSQSSNQLSPSSQPTTGDAPSSVPSTGDTPSPNPSLPHTGDEGL